MFYKNWVQLAESLHLVYGKEGSMHLRETTKAVGPLCLESMPGDVTDPTQEVHV